LAIPNPISNPQSNPQSTNRQFAMRSAICNRQSAIRLVLASASPRRAELLASAGFTFSIDPADVDETPIRGERPEEYVRRVAREKASKVSAAHPNGTLVLGADTTGV